jgi:hypothetical protein
LNNDYNYALNRFRLVPLAIILLTILGSISVYYSTGDPIAKAQRTVYKLSIDDKGSETCSATAIGPHALLTAKHCDDGKDQIYLKDFHHAINIRGRMDDKQDHLIYLVDAAFPAYATVALDDPLAQGERVFSLGSPGALFDIFREGYIAGKETESTEYGADDVETLFDLNGYFGDSGSAIFSKQGNIIAVLNDVFVQSRPMPTPSGFVICNVKFMVATPLLFTKDNIKYATKFNPKN